MSERTWAEIMRPSLEDCQEESHVSIAIVISMHAYGYRHMTVYLYFHALVQHKVHSTKEMIIKRLPMTENVHNSH